MSEPISNPVVKPVVIRPRVVTFMAVLLMVLGLMLTGLIVSMIVTAPEAMEATIRKMLEEQNQSISPEVLSAAVAQVRTLALFLLPNALLHIAAGVGVWRMKKWGMYCFFVLFAWSALSFARGSYTLWVAWVIVLLEAAGAAYLYTNRSELR